MYFKNWIFEHHSVCVALKYHMYCVRIFQLYAVRVIYTRMYTCFLYMLRISFLHLPGAWWLVWDHLPVSPQCSRQGRTKWMGGSCPYYVSCTWSTCKQSTCMYVSEPSSSCGLCQMFKFFHLLFILTSSVCYSNWWHLVIINYYVHSSEVKLT